MTDAIMAKRNARLALGATFLNSLAFILPIWLLYSVNELRLSPAVATALFMCVWFTGGLLEIPTGALADRLGRKRVFVTGNLLLAIYPVAYALHAPVGMLIACCLVSGLGQALQSGALLPLVHRSYEKAGLGQKTYNGFLSTSFVMLFMSRALSGVSGAALYVLDPRWPFIAMCAVTLLNAALGLWLHDEIVTEKTVTNREHIIKTLTLMRRSEVIASLAVAFVLFSLVGEMVWTGYQLFYEADGQSAFIIGALFSVIAVCSAAGAYTVRHLFSRLQPIRLMQGYGVGILLTAVLLYQPIVWLRLLAIFPMSLTSGTVIVVMNATVQQIVPNRYHSTALSAVNLVWYGIYAIGSIGVGVLFNLFGVVATRGILLVNAVAICLALVVFTHILSARAKAYRIQAAVDSPGSPSP